MTAPMRQSIGWQLIRTGLVAWAQQTTGLPAIWARTPAGPSGAPQPVRPYVTLDITSGPTPVGQDATGKRFDATQPQGKEITSVIFGLRSLVVTVNVFSDAPELENNAMSYATALQSSLALESVRQLLLASGLTVANRPAIQNLAELEESVWVSRAALDIQFTTPLYNVNGDQYGYVSEIIGTGSILDTLPTSPASIPFDVKGS